MGYISISVTAGNLEDVLFDLLAGFHGAECSDFEVYNAWSLSSDVNELYLSPTAYACLASTSRTRRFHVVGEAERPPKGCDLLMGDQSKRPATVVELPTFFTLMTVDDLAFGVTQRRDR